MSTDKVIQVCGFALLGAVAVIVLYPIVMLGVMTHKTSSLMDSTMRGIEGATFQAGNPHYSSGAIVSGGDPAKLKKIYQRLVNVSALPGEATRNNAKVHVGLVNLIAAPHTPPDPDQPPTAFTPIELKVADLTNASSLIVADSPITWQLQGASVFKRARLAFEGRAPVDVADVTQGFLAGMRIVGFGSTNATSPNGYRSDRAEFCKSMKVWAEFFDLPMEKLILTHIDLPVRGVRLDVNDWGFFATGASFRNLGTAAQQCVQFNRRRSRR